MIVKGLYLRLRKPEKSDLPIISEWFGDSDFQNNLYGSPLRSQRDIADEAFGLLQSNAKDTTDTLTLIAQKPQGEKIGLMMLNNINWKDRCSELNIIIGNKSHRNFYYGPELGFLSFIYAFRILNFHKILSYVYDHNSPALKLSHNISKNEGVLRQHIYRNGRYVDMCVFSTFAKDFTQYLSDNKNGLLRKHFQKRLLTI